MDEKRVLLEMKALRGVSAENKAMVFAAQRSIAMVCAYCNISHVPESLLGVCVEIGLLLYDKGGYGQGDTLQGLTQMREGEVSFSFAKDKEEGEKEVLRRYKEELDSVRKFRF